ncbi:type III-A CRISPR-associated RAMP protein Csm3 [Ileibacterium valens]|uniref:type III-A CRISPR-associated RAMP protein Csm3 n=1 Tax=Ileibacterium valens TaxID=1862668 RepID=UPI00257300E7|nr:type III-A CRISPR-associated RAMP protein Csm3 [Ileibacterium valens]
MLKKVLKLNYQFVLKSGLHIGGGSDVFDIGGADSTVIKNPINQQPFIPGSSLKGKIRALLTYRDYTLTGQGDNLKMTMNDPDVLSIFAPVEEDAQDNRILITRGIFRDAVLTEESAEELQKYLGTGVFTEVKAENSIDPLKGKAANPRFIERVPAGAKFEGQILLQIFDGDPEEKMKAAIIDGLKMLENSYVGGSGTRGYGRIELLHDLEFQDVKTL